MRRVSGIVLIGLGLFAVVLAILLPTAVVSGSKKTPLNLNITQVSSGPAKVLNTATGAVESVTLRATRKVVSDSHKSTGTVTTVNESLCIVIVQGDTPNCVRSSDPRLLSVTTDTVTANRRSGESVHVAKYNENVNGQAVRHTGLSYKWPIDAKKKTYQFYSPDLKAAFPATYEGTSKIRGLTVYKYVCNTGTQPYLLQGIAKGTYNDTRTVYVEPKTGAIINGVEHQVQTLASGQVALDTTLSFEKSAIDYQSHYAKNKIRDLQVAQIWGPIIMAILAIAFFVGAYFLLRKRDESGPTGSDDQQPGGTPPPDSDPTYGDPTPPPFFAGSSQT